MARVREVHRHSKPNLPQMVSASRGLGLCFATGEGWNKQRGHDRDDRNYHEQFDQRESSCFSASRRGQPGGRSYVHIPLTGGAAHGHAALTAQS